MKEFFSRVPESVREEEQDGLNLENLSAKIRNVLRNKPFIKEKLIELRAKDQTSFDHCIETAELAVYVCSRLANEFSIDEQEILVSSALSHDLGKADLRPEILKKPGKLDDTEKKEMREHIRKGFDYLKSKNDLEDAEVEVRHHKYTNGDLRKPNYDRRSISRGTQERRIPKPKFEKLACLLSIIDIFQSTADSKRPYNGKNGETLEQKRKVLEKFTSPLEKKIISLLEEKERREANQA